MNVIKTWWKRRQLDRAQALIQSYGLAVVKIREIAGTCYIENADGSLLKLTAVKGAK
jgi:hypothetical protein